MSKNIVEGWIWGEVEHDCQPAALLAQAPLFNSSPHTTPVHALTSDADYVPEKMTEEQFWGQYFRSAWFYRDRGLGADADPEIGAGVSDMFSAYQTETTARLPGDNGKRHLERRVNPLVDLTATLGDAQRVRGIEHVETLQRAAAQANTKAMATAALAARGRGGVGGGGVAAAPTISTAAALSKGEMVISTYNRHSFLRVEGTAGADRTQANAARSSAVDTPKIPSLHKDSWAKPTAAGSASKLVLRDAIEIPELLARRDPCAACVELQLTQPPALGGGPRGDGPRAQSHSTGGAGGGWSVVSQGAIDVPHAPQQGAAAAAGRWTGAGSDAPQLKADVSAAVTDEGGTGGQKAVGSQLLRPLELREAFAAPDIALKILHETTALARAQAQELGDGAVNRVRSDIAAETRARIEAIFQSVVELLRHYWARAIHLDRNSVVAPGQQQAAQEQAAKLRGILAKLKEKDAEANTFRLQLLRLQPPSYAEAAMLSPLLAQIRAAVAHDEQA